METYCYSHQSVLIEGRSRYRCSEHILHSLLTVTYDLDLGLHRPVSYGHDPCTYKKEIKVRGQLVQGGVGTDGRTDGNYMTFTSHPIPNSLKHKGPWHIRTRSPNVSSSNCA